MIPYYDNIKVLILHLEIELRSWQDQHWCGVEGGRDHPSSGPLPDLHEFLHPIGCILSCLPGVVWGIRLFRCICGLPAKAVVLFWVQCCKEKSSCHRKAWETSRELFLFLLSPSVEVLGLLVTMTEWGDQMRRPKSRMMDINPKAKLSKLSR